MKTKIKCLLIMLAVVQGVQCVDAEGTAFIYQGRLNDGNAAASGNYDLTFTLYATNLTGSAIAGPVTNSSTLVSNGLFTTSVDFGIGFFPGDERWLEIAVRTNGGASFSPLIPLQPVTPAPYAMFADWASNLSGTLPAAQLRGAIAGGNLPAGILSNNASGVVLTGAFLGNGAGLSNLNASQLNSGVIPYSLLPGFQSNYATVGGGLGNSATGYGATVSGGGGRFDTYFVLGGYVTELDYINAASGNYATIPGGFNNTASGDYSFAAGNQAQALHNGSFVWNDSSGAVFSSSANNQFAVHASGGVVWEGNVQIGTNSADYHNLKLGGGNSAGFLYGSYAALGDGIHLGYNFYYDAAGNGHVNNTGGQTSRISAGYGDIVLAVGDVNAAPTTTRLAATLTGVTVYGTFNNSSDRNAKQDFTPVNPSRILDQVLQLPLSEWSYKTDASARHIGPMGQDFYETFHIGTDEKHIAPIDEGGVAFAAIQGLNHKIEEKDAEIKILQQQNDSLAKRLDELEAAVKQLAARK